MATTKAEIKRWLNKAKAEGTTHMLVVCDTFDHDDYDVPVKPTEKVADVVAKYRAMSMQRVMEVYDLSLDLEMQLVERRAWHL